MTICNTYKQFLTSILLILCSSAMGQPSCTIDTYDDIYGNTSMLRRIAQDKHGLIWFASDNGLQRFDGYQFDTFKSKPGDGVYMPSNDITHLYVNSCDDIWCKIADRVYLFSLRTYQYIDVLKDLERRIGHTIKVEKIRTLPNNRTWLITNNGACIRINDNNPQYSAARIVKPVHNSDAIITSDDKGYSWIMTTAGAYIDRGKRRTYIGLNLKAMVSQGDFTLLLTQRGQLMRYDRKLNRVTRYAANGLPRVTRKIIMVADGWLMAVSDNNIYMHNTKSGVTRQYDCYGNVFDEKVDSHNRIWVRSDKCTMMITTNNGGNCSMVSAEPMVDYHFNEDKNGNIWFIGQSGTIKYYDETQHKLCDFDTEKIDFTGGMFYRDFNSDMWISTKTGLYRLAFGWQNNLENTQVHTRCAFTDSKKRYWLADKVNKTIQIYDANNRMLGYLGQDGKLHKEFTLFDAMGYAMCQTSANTFWIGAKITGLFRLRERQDGTFDIHLYQQNEHDKYAISSNDIYDLKTDRQGRLWIATLASGINCVEHPEAARIVFKNANNELIYYDNVNGKRASFITFTHDDKMLVATRDGLYMADSRIKNLSKMTFRRYIREPNRKESLSNSSIRSIAETSDSNIVICTESAGLNVIKTSDIDDEQPQFKHIDTSEGFPSDVTLHVMEYKKALWVVCANQLIELNINGSSFTTNSYYTNSHILFTETTPERLPDGNWMLGTRNGYIKLNLDKIVRQQHIPQIILTSIAYDGKNTDYTINQSKEIRLTPDQRNITISFCSSDVKNSSSIRFAFRIVNKHQGWTSIKGGHSASFFNLTPGTYNLEIRSTNGNGVWVDNARGITLIVEPKFNETIWAWLLYLLIVCVIGYGAYSVWRYIKKIEREKKETLEAYMQLLNNQNSNNETPEKYKETVVNSTLTEEDDAFAKRIMVFIENNIEDSDINMFDMAKAAATSQSGLSRKMKQIFGVTPMEFLRQARIHRACQLLEKNDLNINQIAFQCGFSDPKYFSRCFKNTMEMTPSEYISSLNKDQKE